MKTPVDRQELDLKLAKLMNEISGNKYVKRTGDTMTGQLIINNSSANQIIINSSANDTGLLANRTDTNTGAFFGVGSGGTNHGVYSNKIGKWLSYADNTNALFGSTMVDLGTVNDCNVPVANLYAGRLHFAIFPDSALNKPSSYYGMMIIETQGNNKNYGRAVAIADYGIYTKVLTNGTWGDWVEIPTGVGNVKPTVNTGMITTANNNLILYKYGKVVYLTGWVVVTYQISRYTNFVYVPEGYRPAQHCSVTVQNGSERIWCYLDTGGNLSAQDNTLKASTTYWMSATWITP